jgi:hypothetical protein
MIEDRKRGSENFENNKHNSRKWKCRKKNR